LIVPFIEVSFIMQRLVTTVSLAMRSLTLHKLRVLLTVLGLIFGVSSVIAMLAIAEGASLEAQRQIADLGATNIIIQSKKPSADVNPSKQQDTQSYIFRFGVTYADYDRIATTIPTVVAVTPLREYRKKVRHIEQEIEARIVGVNPDFTKLTGQTMAQGRFLSDTDLFYRANVCVLGAQSAEKLFPYGDPVGKTIRIAEEHYFEVVGVTSHKASSAGTGSSLAAQDFNRDVYIPLTTDRARFGEIIENDKQGTFTAERIELSQITVTVDSMENVKRTAEALESLLHQFHPKEDYGITVPLELLEKAEATQRIFNLVLGSIASISLLVGGIGIMNIMLATVSERTREIGIRRAIGARRRDIIEQFLIETTVMSSTGGLAGVLLGLAVPPIVSHISGMPAVIRPWSPVLAFLIAVSVGVIFGVYPARRAAMLDPVEALRTE
jgi:putative ABC transport system permease protein